MNRASSNVINREHFTVRECTVVAEHVESPHATMLSSALLFALLAPAAHSFVTTPMVRSPSAVRPLLTPRVEGLQCKILPVGKRHAVASAVLSTVDKVVLDRVIRVANHVPALASLSCERAAEDSSLQKCLLTACAQCALRFTSFRCSTDFGLISMTQMMAQQPSMMATFRAVITRAVGPTSNAMFSAMFSTLATPASFVFLIWPVIGALQLLTVLFSALRIGPPLKQSELSALSLANVCATAWLIVSSNSLAGDGSCACNQP